jgi:Cu2+-exporting ATPase
VEIVAAPDVPEAELLRIAAMVEAHSEHPLAHAILERAGGRPQVMATEFTNIDGQGAQAMVEGRAVFLGNRKLMEANQVSTGPLAVEATRLQGSGRTVVHVGIDGKLAGLIAIADASRPTSAQAVRELQKKGVKVAMITGDNRSTAERIAKELGIDMVLADVLPGDKAAKIKELQGQGHKVGMVGDGINDAPALTQADVGFAIGAGTDVAMESAQVVLMKSDPLDVVGAIELSRATLRKMHQNLAWAVGYNTIAFPLAAGVFYPFTLSPEVAALSMSGSSAIVAINALMLKRTKIAAIRKR